MKQMYGWDGKAIPIVDEEAERKRRIQAYLDSKITVEYIKAHQEKKEQGRVMVSIFGYMEDLMWANRFDIIDDFIVEFCNCDNPEICFQYFVCMLTCAMWAKNELKNRDLFIQKAIETGIRELKTEKETRNILKGLL